MTRVKVCGITASGDRDDAIDAGADALGFLVDVPVDTDRELTPEKAAALIDGVPPFVTSVLVTMPAGPDRALELVEGTGAGAIQLHNDLSVDAVDAVSEAATATVIKGIDADPTAAEALIRQPGHISPWSGRAVWSASGTTTSRRSRSRPRRSWTFWS
jgi:phosphoribosylanthranilate isomerase